MKTVGIVGARGHTGAELIKLIARHPQLELVFVSSRELDGQKVSDHIAGFGGELRYENLSHEQVGAKGADAVILALPNGKAAELVAAIDAQAPVTVVVDLSADYRFNQDWYYGVSGYSGAGTTPSDKNNTELLRDNLMPYALADHMHEREVSRHLGVPVEFMPHVAPHFRGITMTVNLYLQQAVKADDMRALYRQRYAGEPLIRVRDDAPWVSRIADRHGVEIGGFTVAPGGKRLVVVATLDNLLKGAATQAMQNLNTAFGFDEWESIPMDAVHSKENVA